MEEFILLNRNREEVYRKRYENLKKKSIFVQTKNFSQEQVETFRDKNRLEKLSKTENVYIFTNNYEKKLAEYGKILTEKENNLEIEKYELFEGFIFNENKNNKLEYEIEELEEKLGSIAKEQKKSELKREIRSLKYRISEIDEIWFTNEKIEIKDKKYIDEVYKNFDPFLSYRNRVKVRFTEKGLELYEKVLTNRPRLLNKDNNIYTFECDNKLAMVYFAQFFSLIEILEPQELREKLQNELENTLKIYKNEEDKNV